MYLRTARIANYLNQASLAEKLGVTQSAISAWELGKEAVPKARRRQIEALLNLPIQFDIKPKHAKE